MRTLPLLALVATLLSGCTEIHVASHFFKKANQADRCLTEGTLKVGNPYLVDGVRYTPINSSLGYRETGIASWYGADFHGKASANGECYNMYAFTAAHKTLPLPTVVRVTNLENKRSIVLKVNDRGPFSRGRIIDLSYAAAQSLDMVRHGTAPVLVEAIGGPHHYAGGYRGNNRSLAQLPPAAPSARNEIPATLPTVVPSTVTEEDLPASSFQPVVASNQPSPPPPARNIPKPPPYEKRVYTDTTTLKRAHVYVQIGAFSNPEAAATQQASLAKLYPTAATAPLQLADKTLLRVRAGPFRSVADADAALAKIVAAGFTAALIKVED